MVNKEAELASFLARCRAANRKKEQAKPVPSEPECKCTPKTVSAQQMARVEQVIKEQRTEQEKGGWRASVAFLEENFPEEFGPSKAVRSPEPVSSDDKHQLTDQAYQVETVTHHNALRRR